MADIIAQKNGSNELKVLNGSRVVLKPVQQADELSIFQLYTNLTAMKHLPWLSKIHRGGFSLEDSKSKIKALIEAQSNNSYYPFHAFLKSNSSSQEEPKFIGCVGFYIVEKMNNYATAGIILSPEYQSSGYGTECLYVLLKFGFEELGFNRISFETSSENLAMSKWCEKVAKSELESTAKSRIYDGKRYHDLCTYPLFANDWKNIIKTSILNKLEKNVGSKFMELNTDS